MWGGCLLKSWSSTQTTIALSSAEAELYAMSRCAQHALSLASIALDMNLKLQATIHTDASAALGIAYRSGLGGRTRHVKVQYLWIQGAVAQKDLRVKKVGTLENPADMLTKFLGAEPLGRHSTNVGYEFPAVDLNATKAKDNLSVCSELELRFRHFAKHLGIARAHEQWLKRHSVLSEAPQGGLSHGE